MKTLSAVSAFAGVILTLAGCSIPEEPTAKPAAASGVASPECVEAAGLADDYRLVLADALPLSQEPSEIFRDLVFAFADDDVAALSGILDQSKDLISRIEAATPGVAAAKSSWSESRAACDESAPANKECASAFGSMESLEVIWRGAMGEGAKYFDMIAGLTTAYAESDADTITQIGERSKSVQSRYLAELEKISPTIEEYQSHYTECV